MPYLMLYEGLKKSLISSAENEAVSYQENKFYEVAPHIFLTQHAFTIRPFFFSEGRFQKLPQDLQTAILSAGKEASEWGREQESILDEKTLQQMEAQGQIHIHPLPNRDKLMELARPVLEQYAKELGVEPVLNKIEALKSKTP